MERFEKQFNQQEPIEDDLSESKSEILESDKNLNESEKNNAENQDELNLRLKEIRREVDNIGDRLGKPIDDGIKEAVVMFRANELPTSDSCEGHIERGLPVPYVEISAPNEPEERFIGQNAAFEKAARKYNITPEEAKTSKIDDAYWEAMKECSQNEETEEYQKWNEENERLLAKAQDLLEEFYKERQVEPDLKLEIEQEVGGFRVHNGGEDYQSVVEKGRIYTEDEKKIRAKKVEKYRSEIQEFTEFLCRKFVERNLTLEHEEGKTKNKDIETLIGHQEEMARFNKESKDKAKKPLGRIKNYLKILLAGAVLGFGGKMAYEKHEERIENQESAEYVLKSGLQEKAEKAGFNLRVDVPNGDGPYLAHIGYTHSFKADTPSAELLNMIAHDAIMKGNKDAEQLLLSLKEKDSAEAIVFTEGYDDQSIGFLEFVSSIRDNIVSVEAGERAIKELIDIISSLPAQNELPKGARTSFEYLIIKKIQKLSTSDAFNDSEAFSEGYADLKSICEEKLGSFDMQTVYERLMKEGAAVKLFIDGEYEIVPAESSAIRNEIKKEETLLCLLADKLGKLAEPANKGSKEAKKEFADIASQYDAISTKLHREKTLDAREDFAVELIKDTVLEKGIKHGVIPVLYGSGHDFSDNVENLNKSNRKGKIGLITLAPKVYKGTRE